MQHEIKIPEQLHNLEFKFIKLKKEDKPAIEKDWNTTNNYTYNNPELNAWIRMGNNYGVCGGFGGLVIIDSDSKEVEMALKENLPRTFTVRTPHGLHSYFICNDLEKPIRITESQAGDLGDIQFTGKYTVGPTCVHPNGKIYIVEDALPITEINASEIKFALRNFLDLREIIDFQREEKELLEIEIPIKKVIDLSMLKERGREYYGSHPIHGSRGGMNFWVNPVKNVWHCFRHDTGGGPLSWIAVQEGLIECSEARSGTLKGKMFSKVIKIAEEKYNLKIELKKGEEKKYFNSRNFVSKRLGDEILSQFILKTTNGEETIYNYEKGVYKDNGEIIIKEISNSFLGESCREHYVNEVIFYIKTKTYVSHDIINKDKFLINLKNGIFSLENSLFLPHSPNYFFTNQLPIEYNLENDCPKIKKFLEEILREEDIPIIQELFGFCLWRDYQIHKAFMFIGEGANGKSTIINLIKEFLGSENVSSVALQDFDTNRFASAELFGKLANLYADLPDKAMYSTGKFKMITGEDIISGEKKFKGRFNFTNFAKLIFSTNKVPMARDESGAFFRRWIFIKFPNIFEGEKCNPNILREITTPEELTGLFNWSIEGLKRLLKNGRFSYSKTTNEIKELYERLSSSTVGFAKDWLEIDSEGIIEKDEMYAKYVEYCKRKNFPVVANNIFARELKGWFGEQIRRERPIIDGRRVQCWRGVKFVDVNVDGEVNDDSSLILPKSPNNLKVVKTPDIIDYHDQNSISNFFSKEVKQDDE